MKKFSAWLLVLAMAVSCFALPAAATINIDLTAVPHNSPLKHPGLMLVGMTDTVETRKIDLKDSLREAAVNELMESILADEEQSKLIPEESNIVPGRISLVESRRITCEEAPFFVTFRVWGTGQRDVLVFFRAEDSEEWTLVTVQKGMDVEAHFPGNGFYAVAKTW